MTYVPDVTLTVPKTLKLLREVVADKGKDFVYQPVGGKNSHNSCSYVHGNRPGCLVGQVLHRIGVPIKVLRELDEHGVIALSAQRKIIDLPADVVDVLQVAQSKQDAEQTWGQALTAAKERAKELRPASRTGFRTERVEK